jgi:hypothetical protein
MSFRPFWRILEESPKAIPWHDYPIIYFDISMQPSWIAENSYFEAIFAHGTNGVRVELALFR